MNHKDKILAYFQILQNNQINPNFWVSEEYLIKSKAVWVSPTLHSIGGLYVDICEWLLPPIDVEDNIIFTVLQEQVPIYACWPVTTELFDVRENKKFRFLDFQFVYSPKDFLNMTGGKWSVFRKNIRKYPARNKGTLSYIPIKSNQYQSQLADLLLLWSEGKVIQDNEVLANYILTGENRWGLFLDTELVGVNVFDENWKYINYRYCIDDGSPFLNEYLRYCFYTSEVIQSKNKLVNDGGSLGSQSLYEFKKKLNPVNIYVVPTSSEFQVN